MAVEERVDSAREVVYRNETISFWRRGGAKVVESRMRTARTDARAKTRADVGDVECSAD